MSRTRVAGKRRGAQADNTPISKKLMKDVVSLYVFFMFAIYPLYYEDKYYNMGDAKWHFFRWVTLVGVIIMTVIFIWYQIYLSQKGLLSRYWDIHSMSVLDWIVLSYALAALTSFILSPYKSDTLIGYDGWYMGLISQLAFVVLYYFVSRFWRWDDIVFVIYLAVSAVVFAVCILNRFRIDPLEMYKGLDESYFIYFISTLGQATWFSSYMVLLFPMGLFAFWYCDGKVKRIASGAYALLGAMTMIAQNSDSALLAYGAVYLILFCASFSDNKKMRRYLECLVVLFSGWKLIGLLQVAFSDRVVKLSGIMRALSIGPVTWVFLAAAVGLLLAYIRMEKKESFENFPIAYSPEEKQLEWEKDGYKFCLPEDTNRLVDIGYKMNICVGHLYREKAAQKQCDIVYATKNDEYELCVELRKTAGNRFEVVQKSAFSNREPKGKLLAAFNSWRAAKNVG